MSNQTTIVVTFADGTSSTIETTAFTLVAFSEIEDAPETADGRKPMQPALYQFPADQPGFLMESIDSCAEILSRYPEPGFQAIGRSIIKAMEIGRDMLRSATNLMGDRLVARAATKNSE